MICIRLHTNETFAQRPLTDPLPSCPPPTTNVTYLPPLCPHQALVPHMVSADRELAELATAAIRELLQEDIQVCVGVCWDPAALCSFGRVHMTPNCLDDGDHHGADSM
jgi:hypothetical protein